MAAPVLTAMLVSAEAVHEDLPRGSDEPRRQAVVAVLPDTIPAPGPVPLVTVGGSLGYTISADYRSIQVRTTCETQIAAGDVAAAADAAARSFAFAAHVLNAMTAVVDSLGKGIRMPQPAPTLTLPPGGGDVGARVEKAFAEWLGGR